MQNSWGFKGYCTHREFPAIDSCSEYLGEKKIWEVFRVDSVGRKTKDELKRRKEKGDRYRKSKEGKQGWIKSEKKKYLSS